SQASTIKDFPEEVLKSYIDFYFEKNSYEATRSTSIRLFRSIFDQSAISIQKWSQDTWTKCIDIQDDSSEEIILPFSAGSQYVDAKILTCLNQKIATGVEAILTKRANKLGILEMTKENKIFLFDLYSPIAFDSWKNLINIAAKLEFEKFTKKKLTATNEIVNKLSTDTSWLQESSKTQDEFLTDCRPRGEDLMTEFLNSDLDFKTLRYSTISQTTANWSSGICESVFQSTSIAKEFKKRNPPRIEVLQKRILELSDENWPIVEKECLEKNKKVKDKKKLTTSVKSCMQLLSSWNKVISLSIATMRIESKITPKEERELEAWMLPQRSTLEKGAINRAIEKIK
ncbi:MAG: hypothetical protein K2Q18_01930, partial [Bdellovibrionales bacterium]|nr:hypothetical protein [Bdellovibrionales bacterium]